MKAKNIGSGRLWVIIFLSLALFAACAKTPEQWLEVGEKAEKEGQLDKAKEAFQNACEKHFVHGCLKLGMVNEQTGNEQEALKWFQTACEKGAVNGCFYVGAKESDDTKAAHYLKKACEGREYNGCYQLGKRLEKTGDADKAVEYLGLACQKRIPQACRAAGQLEYKRKNEIEATRWFKIGCEDLGDSQLCVVLGTWETDGVKAAEYFRRACKKDDWEGCYRLGDLLEKGGDAVNAKLNYQKACQGGFDKACESLSKMN